MLFAFLYAESTNVCFFYGRFLVCRGGSRPLLESKPPFHSYRFTNILLSPRNQDLLSMWCPIGRSDSRQVRGQGGGGCTPSQHVL